MLKRIHVNKWNMAANRKEGSTRLPAWTIKLGNGTNVRAHAFEIRPPEHPDGGDTVYGVYRPDNPMKCGAVAWLETRATVVAHRADTDSWEQYD